MEWSNEIVLTFLDNYEEEPVIWNPSHPSNKKRNEVYEAWKRIEEKMGREFSVAQLKKKRDSLMASFRIVAKRARNSTKSGSGAADVCKPTWFAYEKMASFLSDKDEPKTTLYPEDIGDSQASDESIVNTNCIQEETANNQQVTAGQKCVLYGEVHPLITTCNSGRRHTIKRKAPDTDLDILKARIEEAYSTLQNIKHKKEKDYCDQYGVVVASRLRELDEWHRDSAINKIDNIIYEEKRRYLERVQSDHSRDTSFDFPS